MKKGEKMSEETRTKIRLSKKGKGNHREGTKHSEETKNKIHLASLGKKCPWNIGRLHTDEAKEKMGTLLKEKYKSGQRIHPMLGKKFSIESVQKMSESHIGNVHSIESRLKMSESHKGNKHWNWKGGLSNEGQIIRHSIQWKLWREEIFKRDSYTCQECYKTKCYIEPHHISPVRSDKDNLFNTKNGITLCRTCHKKTMWKESEFQERYIIKVSLLTK